jgi:GTPase SAR1 family protein
MIPSSAYYRNATGAFIVYDVTCKQSFADASRWLQEVRDNCSADAVVTLVGNKSDLAHLRKVSTKEAAAWAQQEGLFFFETSVCSPQTSDLFLNYARP